MSRLVQRAALAIGFGAALLTAAPALADAAPVAGLACGGPASVSERATCRAVRSAHHRPRSERLVADARLQMVDPVLYLPGRYVSLLILGIGY